MMEKEKKKKKKTWWDCGSESKDFTTGYVYKILFYYVNLLKRGYIYYMYIVEKLGISFWQCDFGKFL